MERLTVYDRAMGWGIKSDKGLRVTLTGDIDAWDKAMERFAAYEDTGLEPEEMTEARPLEEYADDMGDCLWWDFPVVEPPYCGTPSDETFPGYVTHFTRLVIPRGPIKEGKHD